MKTGFVMGVFAVALLFTIHALGQGAADEGKSAAVTHTKPAAIYVTVVGEVKKPGIYEVPSWATLIEAVAVSGGYTEFADRAGVKIYRANSDGNLASTTHNLKNLEGLSEKGISLKNRDKIVVTARKAFSAQSVR